MMMKKINYNKVIKNTRKTLRSYTYFLFRFGVQKYYDANIDICDKR